MTLEQFYAKLAETPRDWKITAFGRIRRYPDGGDDSQCPLSAIRNSGQDTWDDVAMELHLPLKTAAAIVTAADTRMLAYSDIRRRLLNACGLTESA